MYAHGLNTCSAGVYGLNTYSCRRVICQRYLLNNRILLGPCFPLILCGFDQVVLFVLYLRYSQLFSCSCVCWSVFMAPWARFSLASCGFRPLFALLLPVVSCFWWSYASVLWAFDTQSSMHFDCKWHQEDQAVIGFSCFCVKVLDETNINFQWASYT